jgi:hypothetical protein
MPDTMSTRWSELATHVRPIFLRWEKLRLPYNAVLLAAALVLFGEPRQLVRDPWILVVFAFGAVAANVLYLLGPVAESYLHWLGLRGLGVTAVIFAVGCLVSLPLVAFGD